MATQLIHGYGGEEFDDEDEEEQVWTLSLIDGRIYRIVVPCLSFQKKILTDINVRSKLEN